MKRDYRSWNIRGKHSVFKTNVLRRHGVSILEEVIPTWKSRAAGSMITSWGCFVDTAVTCTSWIWNAWKRHDAKRLSCASWCELCFVVRTTIECVWFVFHMPRMILGVKFYFGKRMEIPCNISIVLVIIILEWWNRVFGHDSGCLKE